MKLVLFKLLINKIRLFSNRPKAAGFTLIEILVAIVMAGIIVSSVLSVVVNLLQTDQRESAFNANQSEMQAALDYIATDLRQAVYIYDDVSKIQSYIPNFGSSYQPILAFWKPESVSQQNQSLPTNCNSFTDALKKAECQSLKIRQNTYTLVVYLQSTGEGSPWQGKSIIRRYQLPKYSNMSNLTQSTGYVDPTQQNTSFKNWPKDSFNNSLQSTRPSKDSSYYPVLVDFVDDPNNTTATVPTCDTTNYKRTPATSSASPNNSFFACVRNENDTLGFNQDVFLFLRGNPVGKAGIFSASNSSLPTLQTQVTVRGILDKIPPQ